MGYAGGASPSPSYHSLENHSESIEIVYDPAVISYRELLDVFWSEHSSTSPPYSTQYASNIFYHDEEQKALAEASKERLEKETGRTVYTLVRPAGPFHQAEDYHQKYYLGSKPKVAKLLKELYPDFQEYVASTAAARLNGYAGGNIGPAELVAEMEKLGLGYETIAAIIDAAGESVAAYCPAPAGD